MGDHLTGIPHGVKIAVAVLRGFSRLLVVVAALYGVAAQVSQGESVNEEFAWIFDGIILAFWLMLVLGLAMGRFADSMERSHLALARNEEAPSEREGWYRFGTTILKWTWVLLTIKSGLCLLRLKDEVSAVSPLVAAALHAILAVIAFFGAKAITEKSRDAD